MSAQFTLNPVTNRTIRIGGAKYRALLREGILGGAENAFQSASVQHPHLKDLPPPPPGQFWRKSGPKSIPTLCKAPRRFKEQDVVDLAARARLRDMDLEETPENITRCRVDIEQVLFNERANRNRDMPVEKFDPAKHIMAAADTAPVVGARTARGRPAGRSQPAPVVLPVARRASRAPASGIISESEGVFSDKYTSHYTTEDTSSSDSEDASDVNENYAAGQYGPPVGLSRQPSTGQRSKPVAVGRIGQHRN